MNGEEFASQMKKAVSSVDNMEKKLDKAEKSSDKFNRSLLGGFTTLTAGIASIFTVNAALNGFMSSIEYADQIGETAEAIGVSTENLSAWSDAAQISGGSAEGLQQSVRTLSKDLYQFAETGNSRAAPFLKSFGISMKDASGKARDVFEVLPDIAHAMERMSKQEAIGFGQKLGLDNGTIMLLQQGKEGLEEVIKQQKAYGVVTKEDAEIAGKFKDALENMGKTMRPIFANIASFVLPVFTWLTEKIQKATTSIKEHGVFAKVALMGIATALTMFLLPAIIKTTAALWANPLVWIIAGIMAVIAVVALLAEDIDNFVNGNDSLIGRLAKRWEWFGNIIGFLGEQFKAAKKDVEKVIAFFVSMWNDPYQALEDFKLFLKTIWNDFIDSVPGLRKTIDTIKAIFDTAMAAIRASIEAVTDSITTASDLLTGRNTPVERAEAKGANWATPEQQAAWKREILAREAQQKLQQAQAQTATITTMTSDSITNSTSNKSSNTSVVSNNNINITTGADAKEVAKTVDDRINNLAKTAMQKTDDGVSH